MTDLLMVEHFAAIDVPTPATAWSTETASMSGTLTWIASDADTCFVTP